jgi:hypothetical protein
MSVFYGRHARTRKRRYDSIFWLRLRRAVIFAAFYSIQFPAFTLDLGVPGVSYCWHALLIQWRDRRVRRRKLQLC